MGFPRILGPNKSDTEEGERSEGGLGSGPIASWENAWSICSPSVKQKVDDGL